MQISSNRTNKIHVASKRFDIKIASNYQVSMPLYQLSSKRACYQVRVQISRKRSDICSKRAYNNQVCRYLVSMHIN